MLKSFRFSFLYSRSGPVKQILVVLEFFWQHQQMVSMQSVKYTESSVKCGFSRVFVWFYSALQ